MGMSERLLERRCCQIAELHDCLAFKLVSPNRVGVPDRMFIERNGEITFVEFKQPGGRVRPAQQRIIDQLEGHGQTVLVITTVEDFKTIMGYLDEV